MSLIKRQGFFLPQNQPHMFGNNNKKGDAATSSASAMSSSSSNATNSIVQGTKIQGEIVAQNDIRIDGVIDGTLRCDGRVIIGETGNIKGEVICQNAIIEGAFTGKLTVKDTLDLKGSGQVSGDVMTAKLIIAPGAIFNVNCDMGGNKVKSIANSDSAKAAK